LNLGHLARAERQPAEAQAAYDRAIELLTPLQANAEARHFLVEVRAGRALALAAAGQPAAGAAAADELLRGAGDRSEAAYRAAWVYAGCAAAAVGDERDRYATRAVELLRLAQAAGYFRDPARSAPLRDADFTPLHDRADFRTLLAGLEGSGPPR
jgi:hypothetical protein